MYMAMRFVILVHSGHGPAHYDFMLEEGDHLATWQFEREAPSPGPSGHPLPEGEEPALTRPFGPLSPVKGEGQLVGRKIQDHRLAYLDYQGPVSGGRGHVRRCDGGEYRMIEAGADHLRFELCGQVAAGLFELLRQEGDSWILRRAE